MASDPYNLGLGTTATNPYLGQANPYLQSNIDAASADMVKNYNLSTLPATNAALVKSGSFGNSGVQQMQANDADTLQKNLGNLSNSARMQDYNQQQSMYQWQQQQDANNGQFNLNYGRNLYNDAYSQNANNMQMGINLLGTMNGYTQGDINNSTTQQNTPLNYWNQFQGAANGIANGFGSSTSTQGTSSNPLVSAAGGAQLGNAATNWWNTKGGGSTPISQTNQDAFTNFGNSNGWWGTA